MSVIFTVLVDEQKTTNAFFLKHELRVLVKGGL